MNQTIVIQEPKQKPWFKLRGVEYSTKFEFFLENQIAIGRSNGNDVTYFSRLEKQNFFSEKELGFYGQELKITDKIAKCKEIHKELLSGKFGKGQFIN